MFLDWWMIAIMTLVWFFSIINHGRVSFRTGAEALMAGLHEEGYIEFDKDGEIIGLCNHNREESEDK